MNFFEKMYTKCHKDRLFQTFPNQIRHFRQKLTVGKFRLACSDNKHIIGLANPAPHRVHG